jgi:SMC interacting uncharacterized protein involved in chromosome segregation
VCVGFLTHHRVVANRALEAQQQIQRLQQTLAAQQSLILDLTNKSRIRIKLFDMMLESADEATTPYDLPMSAKSEEVCRKLLQLQQQQLQAHLSQPKKD